MEVIRPDSVLLDDLSRTYDNPDTMRRETYGKDGMISHSVSAQAINQYRVHDDRIPEWGFYL